MADRRPTSAQITAIKRKEIYDLVCNYVDDILDDKQLLSVEDLRKVVTSSRPNIFNDFPNNAEDIQSAIMAVCEEQFDRYVVYNDVNNPEYHQPILDTPRYLKSDPELVREIWLGRWGNGNDRIARLKAAGYSYEEAQGLVNLYTNIAKQLWIGMYGKRPHQFHRLEEAGYDPEVVEFVYKCIKGT